jgi:hypothetical protein
MGKEYAIRAGEGRTGRPRKVNLREMINALRYWIRTGGEWCMLFKTIHEWRSCSVADKTTE